MKNSKLINKINFKTIIFIVVTLFAFLLFNYLLGYKVSAINNTYYIDCSAPVDGDGSIGNPWNTPESLYDHQRPPGPYTFGENDRVLIRRGTTCNYPIRMIRGSGTETGPVIITGYDIGPRPIINGSNVEVDNWEGPGRSDSSAVQIRDFDNIIVEGLELTNTGGDEMDSRRQGIWVLATEVYGAHQNITLRDNYIHNIWGEYKKNAEATAGISIEQRIPPPAVDPSPSPAWFENVLIEDNIIENSYRQGITLWGDWRNRLEDGYNPTGPAWTAWTNVVIQDNELSDIRGDAIHVTNTEAALVQNNVVDGFNTFNGLSDAEILAYRQDAQTKQGLTNLPSRNHAGIWTYNANNTIIQFNDVRGGVSSFDGMAYDIDGGSVGTVIQYNLSQDNEGGFLLICGELGQIRDGIVRYNISKNDGHATITTCVGEVLTTNVYNNTIYTESEDLVYPFYQVDWERFGGDPMADARDIALENNIFVYEGQALEHFFYNYRDGSGVTPNQVDANVTASTNAYNGVPVPNQDTEAITGQILFVDTSSLADETGLEQFESSSGVGVGLDIANNGGRDFFNNSLTTPINIGAVQSVSEDIIVSTGDNNGDGIDDSLQANVSSIINPYNNEIITLVINDVGQESGTPTDCTSIDDLGSVNSSVISTDSQYSYPLGMIDFSLDCTSPGDSTSVKIILDKKYDTTGWTIRKQINSFLEIDTANISIETVNSNEVTIIEYVLQDGGTLDADGLENGTIIDPVGPAVLADSAIEPPDTGLPLLNNGLLQIVVVAITGSALAIIYKKQLI